MASLSQLEEEEGAIFPEEQGSLASEAEVLPAGTMEACSTTMGLTGSTWMPEEGNYPLKIKSFKRNKTSKK